MEEFNTQKDLSRIVGTLKYGYFIGESRKKLIGSYLTFAIFIFLGIVFAITMLTIDYVKDPSQLGVFVGAVLAIIVGLSIPPIIWLIIILKNEKIRKEINLWYDDAIQIKARTKLIDNWNPSILFSTAKIQVCFKIDNKYYSYISGGKQTGGLVPVGYHRVWVKYADKDINILYSPKFDQVMVLKSN